MGLIALWLGGSVSAESPFFFGIRIMKESKMTKKMKKLWFILLLEYFKKQLNYEGFKIVHTINTAEFWSCLLYTI